MKELSLPLEQAGVPHDLVGGPAVFLHVENADSTRSSLTRDIDIMIRREDLALVVAIAEDYGFGFRHSAGIDMLLYGETNRARNAVLCCMPVVRIRKSARFGAGCMARAGTDRGVEGPAVDYSGNGVIPPVSKPACNR